MTKNFCTVVSCFLFFLLLSVVHTGQVYAATLSFSLPASQQTNSTAYRVGDIVTVGVYVTGLERAMNAASGVVIFPTAKLQALSVSKTGSVLTFWVKEPAFSNTAGTVTFEGVVPNPGFFSSRGKLLDMVFKVKSAGTGVLTMGSGMILANDGKGTNMLTGLGMLQLVFANALPEAKTGTKTKITSSPSALLPTAPSTPNTRPPTVATTTPIPENQLPCPARGVKNNITNSVAFSENCIKNNDLLVLLIPIGLLLLCVAAYGFYVRNKRLKRKMHNTH